MIWAYISNKSIKMGEMGKWKLNTSIIAKKYRTGILDWISVFFVYSLSKSALSTSI